MLTLPFRSRWHRSPNSGLRSSRRSPRIGRTSRSSCASPTRDRTEEVVVVLAPLNPWRRDDDYRSGVLRFRAARTVGYGAAPGLVATRLRQLAGVEGELEVLRSIDADRPIATQGPSW